MKIKSTVKQIEFVIFVILLSPNELQLFRQTSQIECIIYSCVVRSIFVVFIYIYFFVVHRTQICGVWNREFA